MVLATAVKRVSKGNPSWQRLVKNCIRAFPRVRSVTRAEQKRIGLQVLTTALRDPALQMKFRRVVSRHDVVSPNPS